jgi:hypothetical protein
MTDAARNWTGYTHQWMHGYHNWMNGSYQWAKEFFMASTHNLSQTFLAEAMGWRSFQSTSDGVATSNLINCPASKEAGYKSNCSRCGLCAGTGGKRVTKSIFIYEH